MHKNTRSGIWISLLATLTLLFPLTPTAAQSVKEAQLSGLKYRNIGPHRGGRVTAVEGVPGEMFTFYMGSTGGGVWKTTDGGLNWRNISDKYFKAGSIGAIAVAPSDHNVVYVGTGSADPRGNVSPGVGMYRSDNGGLSWKHIGLPKAGQISEIAVHPDHPDQAYAAVLGNIFGPSPERGIYRTMDGGENWEKVLFVSDKTGAIDIDMDPSNPRILYAGMWTAERKPWTMIDGSEEGGVWKTTDGGNTWNKLTKDLPDGLVGRVGITISPANPKRIWIQQEAKEETKGGIYRSDDGGISWKRVNRSHDLRQRAWYYSRIFADPKDENTIYALNVSFHKSIDGGKTFERISVPHGDTHDLWINPDHPNVIIQGNDGGACVSFNGGRTWTTQNNQPTSEFYRVSVDNQFPYRVYGAQQDNSTMSVASRTQGGLTPYEDWYSVGGGESGHIAVDPDNPNLIYAGTYIGVITRKELDKGHQKGIVAYPQMHDGTAPRNIKYRFQWNAPIRISPHNNQVVYHCAQNVLRTKDGGMNWEVISPDLTTNKDAYHDIPGGPIQHDHTGVELYTTIFAFEESPHKAGELWAGTDDGRLHISKDDGGNWEEITPKGFPKEATINSIDLSAHTPGRAIIAAYKYRESDFRPYIYLTNDYGKSWSKITNGIAEDHFVRVVREDPKRKGLLFAGTEFGMYISMDEGKNWNSFQLNLPVTPITDMLIKDNDLVLATQGRAFWIMDDMSPLRELTAKVWNKQQHLFSISTSYRSQMRGTRGSGSPTPAPRGTQIYYYLNENYDSTAKISIKVQDARYGTSHLFSTSPGKGETKLRPKKGLNRLVWNRKYDAPKVQKGARFSLANVSGINAAPGEHQVTLTVGSTSETQSLPLVIDPRWSQTEEDLKAQFEAAKQAKQLLTDCHNLIGKIRSMRKQLKAIGNRKLSEEIKEKFNAESKPILGALTDLENELIQTASESGQDPINYPPMLDDQIAYLYSVVNGLDDRPNAGIYERLADLKTKLKPHQMKMDELTGEIRSINKMLMDNGVGIISEER
ncbi:MAG: glycosyl hydrolase [Saprospiraceae bacterium]|nr:glycosyl hydrolase [Saprospiraceae bacterium]